MCRFACAEMQCPSPSGVANEVSWVYKKFVASVSYDRICPFEADLTSFHRVELMRTDALIYATFMSCCPTAADRDRYHYIQYVASITPPYISQIARVLHLSREFLADSTLLRWTSQSPILDNPLLSNLCAILRVHAPSYLSPCPFIHLLCLPSSPI